MPSLLGICLKCDKRLCGWQDLDVNAGLGRQGMNSKFSPVAGISQEKSETKNHSRETHNHEREHEEGKGATQTIYTNVMR